MAIRERKTILASVCRSRGKFFCNLLEVSFGSNFIFVRAAKPHLLKISYRFVS